MTKEEILAEDMKDILFVNKKKMKDDKKEKVKKPKRINVNRNNEKTLDTKKSGGEETNINKEKEKTLDTKKSGGKKVEKVFNNVTLASDDNEPKMSHKVGISYENGRKPM